MKIAYLLNIGVKKESGVLKKVVEQATFWESQGHKVRLFLKAPAGDIWPPLQKLSLVVFSPGSPLRRYSRDGLGVRQVLDWKPEIVYKRFSTYFPPYKFLLNRVPVVLEVNTDDLTEYRYQLSRRWFLYHHLTRGIILKRASGLVYVTRSLLGKASFSSYHRPGIVLANGINLSHYPQLPAPENSSPRLVFLGTPGWPWHGVEKVIRMAELFPQWNFDIIGYREKDVVCQSSGNVHFHGLRERIRYEKILTQADVAIGTMAYHKIQMEEGCPLKIRQYLAYGLPVIIAYDDTDFPNGHPMIFQLPNTPDNVDTHQDSIHDFVFRVKGKRIERKSIACIDSTPKELKRLEFFQQCISHSK